VTNPLARLGLVVAVRGDALVSFLVLGGGFFELDCVDFDAVFDVAEGGVEREGVGRGDLAPFGVFG
jgi:hypothetical protein